MAAFIGHWRPRLGEVQATLPVRHRQVRESFHQDGGHARQAGALATLAIGFDLFVTFAAEIGAISAEVADRLSSEARDSLAHLAERQGQHLQDIDVAERFVEVLRQAVAQGRAVLQEPGCLDFVPRPGVEVIGQRDQDYAYILPDLARRVVSACLREAGEAWDVSVLVLHKALAKRRFVIPGSDGRIEVQRRMGRSRPRVLKMPIGILYDEEPAGSGSGSTAGPTGGEGGAGNGSRKSPLLNGQLRWPAPVAPVAPHETGYPPGGEV
jgi:hypothetical protein